MTTANVPPNLPTITWAATLDPGYHSFPKWAIVSVFTNFQLTKLSSFQNLSLGFILEIFLKFREYQPRYSYKIYSYGKKECMALG